MSKRFDVVKVNDGKVSFFVAVDGTRAYCEGIHPGDPSPIVDAQKPPVGSVSVLAAAEETPMNPDDGEVL